MPDLAKYKGIYKGKELALLCNGSTLTKDIPFLREQKIPVIGINSSWRVLHATCHVAIDNAQLKAINDAGQKFKHLFICSLPTIPTPGQDRIAIPTRNDRKVAFSNDILTKGAWICRSSTHFALQLAYFLTNGDCNIYLCGFDLGGPRIPGYPKGKNHLPEPTIRAQLENMAYIRALIDYGIISQKFRIFITSPSCPCRSIPKFL